MVTFFKALSVLFRVSFFRNFMKLGLTSIACLVTGIILKIKDIKEAKASYPLVSKAIIPA